MFAKLLNVKDRPDSVHVNFIFVAKEGMQNAPRKEAESKLLIDSAFMALLSGQNFYEVANQFSDFKPNPQKANMELGFLLSIIVLILKRKYKLQ
jgi:hypothetical protein